MTNIPSSTSKPRRASAFVVPAVDEDRLRRAFVARFGLEIGIEVTAEAIAWAWEHREQLDSMKNPTGYLFRVGQSRSRRLLRWKRERPVFPQALGTQTAAGTKAEWLVPVSSEVNPPEPQLGGALAALNDNQRTAVILVHCFEWTYSEVAELLGVPMHTVRNRVHRGMTKLRKSLGVSPS